MEEFRYGTIWTKEYDAKEAKRMLEDSLSRTLPAGYTVRHVEKGALVYYNYGDWKRLSDHPQ